MIFFLSEAKSLSCCAGVGDRQDGQ